VFHTHYGQFWVFLNIIVGFLSVFFGSFGGIRQKKIKTLLAYSSISHMGYSLLAFSNFSILGLEMLYFYLFTYVLSNIVIWCVVLGLKLVKKNYKNNLTKDVSDFVLLSKSNKFLALGLSCAFFSLAGIPPLLGFIAKINVILTLIIQQFYIITLLIVFCSVISTFYYIRLIKILYFESLIVGQLYSFKFNNILIFCVCVFFLIFLFFNPTLLYLFIHKTMLFENSKNKFDLFEFKMKTHVFDCNSNVYTEFVGIKNNSFKLIFESIWV
jgi:NADH-quinone oxidoreductase subunit N